VISLSLVRLNKRLCNEIKHLYIDHPEVTLPRDIEAEMFDLYEEDYRDDSSKLPTLTERQHLGIWMFC
jgi:hypothetical protein